MEPRKRSGLTRAADDVPIEASKREADEKGETDIAKD
jgi:hypothetical protein